MYQISKITILSLLLLGMAACQEDPEYKALSFTELSAPPMGYDTSIESDEIRVPAGILQVVKADVEYMGDRYLIGSFVDLSSQDERVFTVIPMTKKNHFLLVGKAAGHTCMDVTVNGDWEECIDVTIE